MATTTNYGWTTPDDTALVKDGASAIRTLGSSVDTTTKALNPSTTLGDIEYRSSTANTNTRLGIGTTGQVLTVSGGVPSWATASAGGITLISETTASALSSLSFSSIPSTYKSLLLVWHGIQHSNNTTYFYTRLNNDSGSNYSNNRFYYNSSLGIDNNNITGVGDTSALSPFGYYVNANDTDVSNQVKGYLRIDNYSSTTKFKFYQGEWGSYNNANGSPTFMNMVGTYKSTSAISSIDILRGGTGTMTNSTNTSIRLYGIS